jgi:hypothetical protein
MTHSRTFCVSLFVRPSRAKGLGNVKETLAVDPEHPRGTGEAWRRFACRLRSKFPLCFTRITTHLATVLVCGFAVCALWCGGASSVLLGDRDASTGGAKRGSGSGSSGSMGGSGGSGSGSASGGGILDQGPTGDDGGSALLDSGAGDVDASAATDAGRATSHGSINCPPGSDGSACDLSSNVCCTCPNCFAPYPTQCFPTATGCVGVIFSGAYAPLTCEDKTNCAAGSVCCASFKTSALTGSSCKPSCGSGDVQLCTGSTECATGKTCQPLTSIPGFDGCQ